MSADAVAAFWNLFRQRHAELAAASSADEPPYDELLEQLQRVHSELYLEFSRDAQSCELIVTADGKQSLFSIARAVAAAAPPIPGWTIHALKPKLGFPQTVQWQGYTLDVASVVVQPLERSDSQKLDLRLFIPGLKTQDAEAAHSAVLRALDSGLGEEAFAETVGGTVLQRLPENATPPTSSISRTSARSLTDASAI